MEHWYFYYEKLWSLLAICIGFYGFFYTSTANESNAKRFEHLYKITKLPIFKKSASDTRGPMQYLVTKVVSGGFFIIGILLLFGVIAFQ